MLNLVSTIFNWTRNLFLFTILAIFLVAFYAYEIEPNWFQIVPINLSVTDLPSSFNGFKIVQISDLHVDDSMNDKKMNKIIKIIEAQQPDIVAITGDFFSRIPYRTAKELLENSLTDLAAREKTVAVLGNHDHYYQPKIIREILQNTNVLELDNSVYTIQRGQDKFHIAGVDDYWKKKSRLDLVMKKLPKDGVAILLAHEPDFADVSSQENRFTLQISGHSHGGQVRIPFRKPPILPSLGKKYPLGRYQVGSMVQYTNRGLGMVKPLVRFGSRPEITVFTFKQGGKNS